MSPAAPYLSDLDHPTLAVLGREWLLHGHLQDRVGMALVMESVGREEMQQIAIDEWMAASPVYSRRMQQALRFPGDGVETICKNLQLDIGAPHEFMDFRFRLIDAEHAEFWLAHCGALMDVEPMGVDFVHGMCHTIEDPTFDATAAATNPRAAIRPLHRPPRVPAGRTPHCHWRIDITAAAAPVAPHPLEAEVARSRAAQLDVRSPDSAGGAGRTDYSGPFDPDLRLEDFSRSALEVACEEFALQSHLLLRSLLLSVSRRLGADRAAQILPRLLTGWCGLTAQRLRDALGLAGDLSGLATMLALHPMLAPRRYVAASVEIDGDAVRLGFRDCAAAQEGDALTWVTALGGAVDAALAQIVAAFDPHARLTPTTPAAGELHSYRIRLDPEAAPIAEPPELSIAKISSGAAFRFREPSRQAGFTTSP
ncbi:MAG TPA: hypothetical protein VG899_02830 [Mycobacteriales bacterium]|nr:hypothetical protein [Mycobacteriales bacterium]